MPLPFIYNGSKKGFVKLSPLYFFLQFHVGYWQAYCEWKNAFLTLEVTKETKGSLVSARIKGIKASHVWASCSSAGNARRRPKQQTRIIRLKKPTMRGASLLFQ